MGRADDLRLGALLSNDPALQEYASPAPEKTKYKVAIIGYPCDDGVARNGGIIGAKGGPDALRQILPKIGPVVNPEFMIDIRCIELKDAGNVALGRDLDETHRNLEAAVSKLIQDGYIPVVVGGGNDQSYPNARALMKNNGAGAGNIGVVNIDAHLDARPLVESGAHSGSPFRQLLNDGDFTGRFHEFALQGNQCSVHHVDFVQSKGAECTWLSQIRKSGCRKLFENVLESFAGRSTFVSFDIDSISSADCPGVSCQAVVGLSAQDALDICMAAGQHPGTRLLDISEFNPATESKRTSRLVATMIYYFLLGIASRK